VTHQDEHEDTLAFQLGQTVTAGSQLDVLGQNRGMRDVARLRLDIAYDGTEFSGWASQPGRRTVQATLESAVVLVLRLPGAALTVAGRTDAGVHARAQVCHVDVPAAALADVSLDRLTHRLSRVLPADVRVRRVAIAPAGFDARFSALWRRYAYRVCDVPAAADPMTRGSVLWWPRPLDVAAMNSAATALLGDHDFAAFCKPREGATTIRTLQDLSWTRSDAEVTARVVADAFCHSMVRSLVGCLLGVGEGKRPVSWPVEVLRRRTRDSRVHVVAAHGLTLEEVGYPADAELAARAAVTRTVRTPI
jgi:tRNA pseudouridine38-40 synthase